MDAFTLFVSLFDSLIWQRPWLALMAIPVWLAYGLFLKIIRKFDLEAWMPTAVIWFFGIPSWIAFRWHAIETQDFAFIGLFSILWGWVGYHWLKSRQYGIAYVAFSSWIPPMVWLATQNPISQAWIGQKVYLLVTELQAVMAKVSPTLELANTLLGAAIYLMVESGSIWFFGFFTIAIVVQLVIAIRNPSVLFAAGKFAQAHPS